MEQCRLLLRRSSRHSLLLDMLETTTHAEVIDDATAPTTSTCDSIFLTSSQRTVHTLAPGLRLKLCILCSATTSGIRRDCEPAADMIVLCNCKYSVQRMQEQSAFNPSLLTRIALSHMRPTRVPVWWKAIIYIALVARQTQR